MKHILRIRTGCCSRLLMALTGLALLLPSLSSANPIVQLETDLGVIKLELFADDAPLTVENFISYVKDGHYEGTFFHRSVPGFVLQGGGFAFSPDVGDGMFFSTGTYRIFKGAPVLNEPGLSNVRGTVAMAKIGGDPDSATNEWFFNMADNSANLDFQNGGFTVFGQVIEDGMSVVDAIVALDRCENIPYDSCFNPSLPLDLGPTPFINAVANQDIQPQNIVKINKALLDSDGDGYFDDEENGHPNGGDGNDDGMADALQDNVVSFVDVYDNYITMSVPPGTTIDNVTPANTAAIGTTNPSASMAGLNFAHSFYGFNIVGVEAEAAVAVDISLPAGELPVTYFMFGATPDDPTPHWYEFLYDGETGAEINGNVVTLHFVDGKRGDSDLAVANDVQVSVGGPAVAAAVTGAEDTDSGGGCALSGRENRPSQAGAWWLLLTGLGLLGMRRAHARTTY